MKRAKTKSRNGEVTWKLDTIKFADFSSVQSKVFFATADPKVTVPESGSRSWMWKWCSEDGIVDCKTGIPIILISVVTLPVFLLVSAFEDHGPAIPAAHGAEYSLPANATVAVIIKKNHEVHY